MRKKLFVAVCMAAMLATPAMGLAEANAGAGEVTLLGHIDFVGRYSDHDNAIGKTKADNWNGYETYNVEFAVLGIAGKLGDNVSWVITEAFAFEGPFGPANSLAANSTVGYNNNAVTAMLLDARINLHLGEAVMISAGRFIPPTSMTCCPHLMKVMHTINYPLINGSGFQAGGMAVPLPMYQTGVMLTLRGGPVSVMVGNFNGTNITGGSDFGGLAPPGVSNTMDINKTKGTVAKLSVDVEGVHFGAWHYGESASVRLRALPRYSGVFPAPPLFSGIKSTDASINQWGAEFSMDTEVLILQGQYMQTALNFHDSKAKSPLGGPLHPLYQSGWYALLGFNLGEVAQIVGRYDYFDYDNKKIIALDGADEEGATTLGLNFLINEGTTLGLNYTFRYIEDWEANQNEYGLIIETNLF